MREHVSILLLWWLLAATQSGAESSPPARPLCCAVSDAVLEDDNTSVSWDLCLKRPFRLPERYETHHQRCYPEACRLHERHDHGFRTALRSPPHKVLQCLNAVPELNPTYNTSEIHIADDSPVNLRAVATWRSSKRYGQNVTVVTQLSLDRLPQLLAQCNSWRGPLSAAIYMNVPPEEEANFTRKLKCAVRQVMQLFWYAEEHDVCALTATLLYERKPLDLALRGYPVNTLRNIARVQARTELIALLDVDFLASRDFMSSSEFKQSYPTMAEIARSKGVIVIPAFDFVEEWKDTAVLALWADRIAAANKTMLLQSMQNKEVNMFCAYWKKGHAPTNYSKWATANTFYEVPYATGYEPFVVIHRRMAPWHDSRYRGYALNKIEHLAHMNWTGYKFMVHPTAFTIHRAHEPSAAKVQHVNEVSAIKAAEANGTVVHEALHLAYVHALFDAAKAAMANGTFVPELDNYTRSCIHALPWWHHSPLV